MDKLDSALDDIEGLLEAHRALSDESRSGPLRQNAPVAKQLQRELATAADTYAAMLVASARGDVSTARLRRCRQGAQVVMADAVKRQAELAALVRQRRAPMPAVRDDIKQLATMSLQFRAAVAALAPTVDRRAANALSNKVLVELRAALLLYLASVRESGDAQSARPRAAVVALLDKTEGHASELAKLATPATAEQDESLGVTLSKHAVELLHTTALDWKTAGAPPA
jgi:hypothetical protein